MDENNNNSEETLSSELVGENPVTPAKQLDAKLIIAIAVIVLVVVGIIFALLGKSNSPEASPVDTVPIVSAEPEREDFGTNPPQEVASTVEVPAGVVATQSYSLKYTDQTQNTYVFDSPFSIQANFDKYEAELKDQSWTIVNQYKSEVVSSLYGTKDTKEINITISASEKVSPDSVSQVSISVVNK
jgi:flagellar basal body-associated protein FliL